MPLKMPEPDRAVIADRDRLRSAIAELPDDKPAPAMAGGGMGGMDF